MKYVGSEEDINLSNTQFIWLLGSDIISQSIENDHTKRMNIITIKDPNLLEVIKTKWLLLRRRPLSILLQKRRQ